MVSKAIEQLKEAASVMLSEGVTLAQAEEWFRTAYITCELARSRGNKSKAARHLGVHRNTLSRSMPIGIRYKKPPQSAVGALFERRRRRAS